MVYFTVTICTIARLLANVNSEVKICENSLSSKRAILECYCVILLTIYLAWLVARGVVSGQMKPKVPEKVREQMRKAGQARAAQMTTEDRRKFGRKAWQTRIANASKEK